MKLLIRIVFACLCSALLSARDAAEPVAMASEAGFVATAVANGEEGGRDTVISRDGKVLASVRDAAPVSFGPDGTILLLREAMADDDSRHFLLNLGAGEFRKDPEKRREWVIGGRHVTRAEWSAEGRTVTLTTPDAFGGGSEMFEVAEYVEGK